MKQARHDQSPPQDPLPSLAAEPNTPPKPQVRLGGTMIEHTSHDASLIIGIGAFLLVAIFFLVKWIVSAIVGNAAFHALMAWRHNRRMRKAMYEHDMKTPRSSDNIDSIE